MYWHAAKRSIRVREVLPSQNLSWRVWAPSIFHRLQETADMQQQHIIGTEPCKLGAILGSLATHEY